MRSVGPDSKQSWIVAAACFSIQIMAFGMVEVSGLFFVATVTRFNTGRDLASLPYTLTYCTRSALGPLIGYLGFRFGIRRVTLIGCALSAVAVGACFFVNDIITLIIIWGIGFGFCLGLETSLLNVILNEHFVKNRVKANGLNAAGCSIGSMILAPLISYLIEDAYGISGTFLIISGLMLHNIPAAIVILLNKTTTPATDVDACTSDVESTLEANASPASVVDVKTENGVLKRGFRNKIFHDQILNEEIKENGTDNSKLNLVLSPVVQCDVSTNERKISNPHCDERRASKNGDEIPIVTNIQTQNDSFNYECGKMHSRHSTEDCSSSLIFNPNQLNVAPEGKTGNNPLDNNRSKHQELDNSVRNTTFKYYGSLERSTTNNTKSPYSHSLQTFENSQNIEAKDNEMAVQLIRDGNQSTATSLSELSNPDWKSSGTYLHNKLEYKSNEKLITKNLLPIPNLRETTETDNSVPNPTRERRTEDDSKWQIYRLVCNPVYLVLLVGSGVYYFSVTMFLTVIVDFATDIGLSITLSSYILVWVGLWDIIAYATLGFVFEKRFFTQSKFAALSYLGMCVISSAMVWSPGYVVLFFLITLFEFSQAGVIILSAPLVAELIDQDLQATTIASVTLLSAPVSLAISPLIGFFRDGYGSYKGLFYVNSASLFLCSLLFLCIPKIKQHLRT